jgi:hypothetical protein
MRRDAQQLARGGVLAWCDRYQDLSLEYSVNIAILTLCGRTFPTLSFRS